MKTRTSKTLAFGAALIMATLAMNSAFADGNKSRWNQRHGDSQAFKIRIAGGFVQNIQQERFPPGFNLGVENRSIALVKGRGTFGRVDIMAVTVSAPPSGKLCSSDLPAIADILENNLVLTFGDLSLLYGNGTGIVCPNVDDPEGAPIAEVEGTWDGGTGRFRRAGGKWSIRFDFARPVGADSPDTMPPTPDTQFIAETGVIKGHITGLRRGDRDDD